MDKVRNVAVLKVLEGEQMGSNGAGVLERACLLPAEGLACGESEGKGEFVLGEVEWDPFWMGFRLLGGEWWGFGGEGLGLRLGGDGGVWRWGR